MNKIPIVLLIIILTSCGKYPKGVAESLNLAGGNRSELEKVLEHYRKTPEDNLKYKAACYLIDNMKWHSSLDIDFPEELMRLYIVDDSLSRLHYKIVNELIGTSEFEPSIIAQLKQNSYQNKKEFYEKTLPKINLPKNPDSDLTLIDSGFLLNNIETAFITWQNKYNKHLDFEQFCEYVLPYRTNNEPIMNIRHVLQKKYNKFLAGNSVQSQIESIDAINALLRFMNWDHTKKDSAEMPDLGFFNILFRNISDCDEHVEYGNQVLRSVGIPCAFDYTPQWLERDHRHFWFTTFCDTANIPFYAINLQPGTEESKILLNMASTVFRKTFKANKETPFFLKAKTEPIPSILSSPCMVNVTEEYHGVSNITIDISDIPDKYNLCYFCIFTPQGWAPVQWGKIKRTRKEVTFELLPVNSVGIPCFYKDNRMVPCGRLVQVKQNDKYKRIRADARETETLRIFRKYPYKYRMYNQAFKIPTSYVQGSNNEDFIVNDTLITINDTLPPFLKEYDLNNTKFYRYYRLVKNRETNAKMSNVAELIFLSPTKDVARERAVAEPMFNSNLDLEKVHYKVPGNPIGLNKYKEAFDNNLETFSTSFWIGMDFVKPVKITKIRIAPRNANNMIIQGDTYELFYWNEKWISAGKKTAEFNFLDFDDIPSNTIYWLRNLTRGKEELPFFYEDGVQYFTNHDDFLLDENFIRFNNKVNHLVVRHLATVNNQ